jgi:hypothetical protein
MGQGIQLFFTMAAVVGGPLLAVMVVPALAKRFVKATAQRVAELEERVDFAERLLAQQRDTAFPRAKS